MPARTRTGKPFAPKPNEPGARVTWTHVHADGTAVERTGEVWASAPTLSACVTLWVIPDRPLPTDPYRALCVMVLPRNRSKRVGWGRDDRGMLGVDPHYEGVKHQMPRVSAGGAYSEDHEHSLTGAAGHGAARQAERSRARTA